MAEPLQDPAYFAKVRVDPELGHSRVAQRRVDAAAIARETLRAAGVSD